MEIDIEQPFIDRESFIRDIAHVINRFSMENHSNTPDLILAEYLLDCLLAFGNTSRAREKWYGKSLSIGSPSQTSLEAPPHRLTNGMAVPGSTLHPDGGAV